MRPLSALYATAGGRLLGLLPPETAHRMTIRLMQSRFAPGFEIDPEIIPRLTQKIAGLAFATPLGLAAGFDKNAEIIDPALRLGFSFVEAGAVTPRQQAGNPAPRVFRLREDRAVINRYGFNNDGLDIIARRLMARKNPSSIAPRNTTSPAITSPEIISPDKVVPDITPPDTTLADRASYYMSSTDKISRYSQSTGSRTPGIVGINLGANKDSDDKIEDYINGLIALSPYTDFCTINISSPNTPGLRALQDKSSLEDLLRRIFACEAARATPVFLKISPDIDEESAQDILGLVQNFPLSALIISNTTIGRPDGLISRHIGETGGLSGKPLFDLSTRLLRDFASELKGALPLVGVGGISSPREAYLKILAGASLIQIYTALIYEGPQLPSQIIQALPGFLDADGFSTITEAIGADI